MNINKKSKSILREQKEIPTTPEEILYEILHKYDKYPDDEIDPYWWRIGQKIEMEHTSNPKVAKAISKGHLVENRLYYKYLIQMEKALKKSDELKILYKK